MTLNQATKRLEKMALHLEVIRGRIEALTKDMSAKPARTTKVTKATKVARVTGKRGPSKAIGAVIVLDGEKATITQRISNSQFWAEHATGKRSKVSTALVYGQLKRGVAIPGNGKTSEKPANAPAADQPAPQEKVA